MIDTDHDVDPSITERALARALGLIERAAVPRSRDERRTRARLRRLFADPSAVAVTITLTDEVMRFRSPRSAASALRAAVSGATTRGFGVVNLIGLRATSLLSRVAPSLTLRVGTAGFERSRPR